MLIISSPFSMLLRCKITTKVWHTQGFWNKNWIYSYFYSKILGNEHQRATVTSRWDGLPCRCPRRYNKLKKMTYASILLLLYIFHTFSCPEICIFQKNVLSLHRISKIVRIPFALCIFVASLRQPELRIRSKSIANKYRRGLILDFIARTMLIINCK